MAFFLFLQAYKLLQDYKPEIEHIFGGEISFLNLAQQTIKLTFNSSQQR